jgi:predicted MFS family arabinose efflux permease
VDFLASARRRRLLFGALYLSEGAPIGYIWWYLPTKLRVAGIPVEEITGLTAALVLPWTLKFLWAPLIDISWARGWPIRGWILASQTAMVLLLLPLFAQGPGTDFALLGGALLLHAMAAATQDVSIDALAIRVTPPEERGRLNAWMQGGMVIGRALFGGAALLADEHLGSTFVLACLMATIGFSALLLLSSRESGGPPPAAHRSFGRTLRAALRDRRTGLGLLFALLGGAAFESVGAVAGPYLVDRGYSQGDVGWFLAVPVVGALVIGAFAGGYLADRLGRVQSVFGLLLTIAASVLVIAVGGEHAPRHLPVLLGFLYLAIGAFTASSYGLFMDLTHRQLGATQFSAYMGATNACEAWSSFAVGRLIAIWSYAPAFVAMAAISLLAVPVLRRMGREPPIDLADPRSADPGPARPPASPPVD